MPDTKGEKKETRDELGRFIPGVVNNPSGRPKGTLNWASTIEKIAEEECKDLIENKKMTKREAVAWKLWQMGMKGDIQAIKEIGDRMDGKARQNIGLDGGADGTPIIVLPAEIIEKNDLTSSTAEDSI